MKTARTFAAAALAASLCAALPAEASNYPPDYDYCSLVETRYAGPFEVIRDWVQPDQAKLTVAYRGYLRDHFADDEINIYIRLNGNDAFIPARSGSNDDAYIFLNSGPRDCHIDMSNGSWICSWPTPVEDHVFFWGWSQTGVNAWDIELAAEANGWWDSNWGNNYYARFEPVSCGW